MKTLLASLIFLGLGAQALATVAVPQTYTAKYYYCPGADRSLCFYNVTDKEGNLIKGRSEKEVGLLGYITGVVDSKKVMLPAKYALDRLSGSSVNVEVVGVLADSQNGRVLYVQSLKKVGKVN